MQYGLFGKLPAKRDFIAHAVPRAFLQKWEPWLEKSLSESRLRLCDQFWDEAFCRAPIWRFWLGAETCGSDILGAMMPSVDSIGRYFPLTIIAISDGEELTPPSLDPYHAWFETLEEVLLSAFDPGMTLDRLLLDINNLAKPMDRQTHSTSPAEAMFYSPLNDTLSLPLVELFESCRQSCPERSFAASTFWWTIGGMSFRPIAWAHKHLPDTSFFTGMLTGCFENKIEMQK